MVQLESKFKINILWPKIWGTLHGSWIEKYNRALEAERIYVHSALGYLSPLEFEQKFYQNYYQEVA